MSEFNWVKNEWEYPLLEEQVDLKYYNLRKIRHIFWKPSKELETLVINLAHNKECAILAKCFGLSRPRMKNAVKVMVDGGYLELFREHSHNPDGAGKTRVYQRTPLFEEAF
jgi:hypothetical protein